MPSGVNFSFAWKSDTNSNQRNSKNTNSKSSNGQTRRTTPQSTSTTEIRIKLWGKSAIEPKIRGAYERLKSEYPQVALPNEKLDSFIQKVFQPKISQQCVLKNQSFNGEEKGHVIRRAAIYNLKSSYLSKRLPEDKYVVFYGRVTNGEFVIDDLKVIDNPKKKADDYEAKYTFYYDGPNHANALYDITQTAAENAELIGGEISSWNDYLDWKKQLAEMRIKGIKYIAVRVNLEEQQMSFLTVAPNKEALDEFKIALFRNEMSVFSNDYSTDRWKFEFNREIQNSPNSDNGIALQFIDFGEQHVLRNMGYLSGWDEQREYCKKDKKDRNRYNIGYFITELRNNYPNAYLCELKFDLSSNGSSIVERKIRRNGGLNEDDAEDLINEFYGEGYIAASQIGDFALIGRLKGAIRDLVNGKSVSQNLDEWLFDIGKARVSKKIDSIDKWQNEDINEEQKMAVKKVLAAPDVCLIQGPPGTGKTTVIAEAIYQLVVRGKRVLVTSQANLAVDNALERLITNPNVRAIRLGDYKKITESVDNITERKVLETFYNSIEDYVNREYVAGWDEEDEIIRTYDEDKHFVLDSYDAQRNIKIEIRDTERKIAEVEQEIDLVMKDSERESEIEIMHEAEKASIQLIRLYCQGTVSNVNFALSKDSISRVYKVIERSLMDLKAKGIVLTRAKIELEKLSLPTRLRQANDVVYSILISARQLIDVCSNIESGIDIDSNQELENLKAQQKVLMEKMVTDATPEVISEWQNISNQIKDFNEQGAGGAEALRELFVFDEEDMDISKFIENTLMENKDAIYEMLNAVNIELSNIEESFVNGHNIFEEKISNLEIELDELKSEIESKSHLADEMTERLEDIYRKYNADEDDIIQRIETKKEQVNVGNHKINREKWEPIFRGFSEWIGDIPDFVQENDMYLDSYVNGCNVVGVSCTENTRTLTEKGFDDFDVVIIDEVSKATPPELLIPLIKGRKAVLVGDHRQLPPLFNEHEKSYFELVATQEDEVLPGEFQLSKYDFEKYKDMVTSSLFQRYFENGSQEIKHSLLIQYRMHSDIMDIVNFFYDGKLKDGAKNPDAAMHKAHNLTIDTIVGTEMIIPKRHAYWFDSSTLRGEKIFEQRKKGSTSTENILECYMILELLKKMEFKYANQNIERPVSVGIISFYFDQVKSIRNVIKEEHFHYINIEINTVDRFQGKEKEIIIVSLVRNTKSERRSIDSHIAAFQRINVGFSRAQNLLIVVGASEMYANQPVMLTDMDNGEKKEAFVYKEIIEMLDMKGTYYQSDDIITDVVADEVFESIKEMEVKNQ